MLTKLVIVYVNYYLFLKQTTFKYRVFRLRLILRSRP